MVLGTLSASQCDMLEADLTEIVNVETGKPLAHKVLRSSRDLPGEHSDVLPDLLVRWNREAPIRKMRSEKTGAIARESRGICTGDHRNTGMFLAVGPDITAGDCTEKVAVTDLAPTLSALLGVELPGLDGKPIARLCGAGI